MYRSLVSACLVLAGFACSASAGIAYNNLPPPGQLLPGFAGNIESADDLILDLSGGSIAQSASLRIIGADQASGPSRIRVSLYSDNAGRPGTWLTGTAVTIAAGGPAVMDQLVDFPDVLLPSATIWVGLVFEIYPQRPCLVGFGTLPTIGQTTPRAATRFGPDSWVVQGASGPPEGGGIYSGDRIQIAITTIPAPSAAIALLVPLMITRRRARHDARV